MCPNVYEDVHHTIVYYSKKSGHNLCAQQVSAAILNDDKWWYKYIVTNMEKWFQYFLR